MGIPERVTAKTVASIGTSLSSATERSTVVLPENWVFRNYPVVENRYNFYLMDIRLLRDNLLYDTIIGQDNDLNQRTKQNLRSLDNDLNFLYSKLLFYYFPDPGAGLGGGIKTYIDPYDSYPYTFYFEQDQATRLRQMILNEVQSDIEGESWIDIAAYGISYANGFNTDWLTVRDTIVKGEWVVALLLSGFFYSQNEINTGLVVPLLKTPKDNRFAGVLRLKSLGSSMSPQMEIGCIYETPLYVFTTVIRHRYGGGTIYSFFKQTLKMELEADLFSRTYFGNFMKLRWQNIFEIRLQEIKVAPDEETFDYVHDYILRFSTLNVQRGVSREYAVRLRALDLRLNTVSLIIPAIIFERKSGFYPLIKNPLTFKIFFEGGYGVPFTLESEDDLDRGEYFLLGCSLII